MATFLVSSRLLCDRQVSQLMILTKTRGISPFPDLESSALSVMEAVQHMVEVGKKITAETTDEARTTQLFSGLLFFCCFAS